MTLKGHVRSKRSISAKNQYNFNWVDDKTFATEVCIMRAPSKAHRNQLVKIQLTQRLTACVKPNLASVAVTKQMKPRSGMYQAATQVNVLSPEMFDIVEVDAFH